MGAGREMAGVGTCKGIDRGAVPGLMVLGGSVDDTRGCEGYPLRKLGRGTSVVQGAPSTMQPWRLGRRCPLCMSLPAIL
jgi:hypothetical protein